MSRPEYQLIDKTTGSWGTQLQANFDIWKDGPLPIHFIASGAAVPEPEPEMNSQSIVLRQNGADYPLEVSNDSEWVRRGFQAALQNNSNAFNLLQLRNEFNQLLQKLRDSGLMASS